VVLVDLVVQEKNNFMRIKDFIFIALAILLFGACSSTNKLSTPVSNNKSKAEMLLEERMIIEASQLKLVGKINEAERKYQELLSQNPSNDVAMYELARIKDSYNQMYEAIMLMEKAVSLNNSNKWYYVFQADLYRRASQFENLPKVYNRLHELEPNNIEFLDLLATSYILMEEYTLALEKLNLLEEKIGINEDIAVRKKDIYLKQGKKKKAMKEIEILAKQFPGNSRYYSLLAELYLGQGMDKEALYAYEQVVKINPDDPYIHFTLADFYKKKDRKIESLNEIKLGFENENLSADSKIQLLLKLYDIDQIYLSNPKETMDLIQVLAYRHPESPDANSLYAYFLSSERRYEESYVITKKVLENDKSKYVVWESFLNILLQLQLYMEIDSVCNEVTSIFPYQPLPYLYQGLANIQLKNYDKAVAQLSKGQGFVFDNDLLKAEFFTFMGDAYYELEDHSKSYENYDKSLNINPDNALVLNNYSYHLSIRGERLEDAKVMSSKALELDSDNPSYTDTYGWILFKLEEYVEAEQWIKKSIDATNEPSAEVLEHYGDVQFKLGNLDKAIKFWYKALELNAESEVLKQKIESKKID
jgi:tetratricopeptide (TPR) repeat protein